MARNISHQHLVPGLAAALRAGALTPDAVALEARKAAEVDAASEPRWSQLLPDKPRPTATTVAILAPASWDHWLGAGLDAHLDRPRNAGRLSLSSWRR
jgi:hypothetical protein